MKQLLPDPAGLEFQVWGNQVAEQLANYGVVAPMSEQLWQEWAASLLIAPKLGEVPDPYGFTSWQLWGQRLLETPLG